MVVKNVNVPILPRVEGEGALELFIEDENIKNIKLRIYEPPRFFEKFLENRNYYDVVDVVARICGICPVAYQMSAVHALEKALNIRPIPWVREMRRLFYCGEWIESHSLHIHFLAAPDFLGLGNALEMASGKYQKEVKRGIKIQNLGNNIVRMFGGRSVHPVGACVGGFFYAPSISEIKNLLQQLYDIEEEARDLIKWVSTLPLPIMPSNDDIIYVSLSHPQEYPFNEGKIISNKGLNIDLEEYEKYFKEGQREHTTALYSYLQGKAYLVGPLARLNNNFKLLPPKVLKIIDEIGLALPSNNMFHSIIARSIEIYYSILEAISILEHYQMPDSPKMLNLQNIFPLKSTSTGYGCTEAPRGLLWHRYQLDKNGIITFARIVPPTSQNQARIEEDLNTSLINFGLDRKEEEIRLMAEMIIRNYDPCISCSVHLLDIHKNKALVKQKSRFTCSNLSSKF
ncbi:MAG: nickel-dependent hydrogenase large subunit [Oligoflexia bacterium]|nr:nickel-dependent hydrogenase large subunit [Oligoflexia bacterium]